MMHFWKYARSMAIDIFVTQLFYRGSTIYAYPFAYISNKKTNHEKPSQ
jgi:hypothetical protein